jgi:peptidoglycan hydrolase-like protein with peptidoglycan-binding domain
MKPFWARLVFLGFMALAGAISYNALHMPGKRPPPEAMASTRKEPGIQQKPAVNASQTSAAQAPSTPATAALGTEVVSASSDGSQTVPKTPPLKVIRAIRRELKLHGYRPGAGRGSNVDLSTRAAIINFEFDHGLQLTGEPSEALLKSLLFASTKRRREPASDDKFERNQELVREIQAILAQLGFSSVAADGTMSEGTREAIKRFEASRKLPESGRLGERLLLEIIVVSGRRIGVAS